VKIFIFSLSILFFSQGCSGRSQLAPGEIPDPPKKISKEEVNSAFNIVASAAEEEGTSLVKSGSRWQRVKKIIDKISYAANLGQSYPYPFYIAENDDPELTNAYVAQGNIVVVYSTLADKVSSDAELSTILGHEIGHMLAKHNEDRTAEERESAVSTGSSILGSIAGIATAIVTGSSAAGNMAGDLTSGATEIVGTGAFVRSYDRDMEREADSIGLILMAKAGYDPNSAIDFWKKADTIFGGGSGIAFMSTHPSNSDRAEDLEEQVEIALPFYKGKSSKK
jgi:predicted Zn-dependent protease